MGSKKTFLAIGATVLLVGVLASFLTYQAHSNSKQPIKLSSVSTTKKTTEQPTATATSPAPTKIPTQATTQPTATTPAQTTPNTPTTQTLLDTSGTGASNTNPVTFTPTTSGWSVNYTYTGCGANGVVFTMRQGSTAAGRPAQGDSGSGTLAGFSAINSPVTISVGSADQCSWTVTAVQPSS